MWYRACQHHVSCSPPYSYHGERPITDLSIHILSKTITTYYLQPRTVQYQSLGAAE